MLLLILFAILPDAFGHWLIITGLGAYHGLNPGMGWLFALSLGFQQQNERAVWKSLFPIAGGHALSIILVIIILMAGLRVVSFTVLQWITALILLIFGCYKLFNYYRHPKWVGLKVNYRDLFAWSFLMATAHGSGLMIAPSLLGLSQSGHEGHHIQANLSSLQETEMIWAVGLHTFAMFLVMGAVAWIVYKKVGLAVLRQNWINFDLLWAIALLLAGGIALLTVVL